MANPALAPGALAKPSRLDRDVAKHQRRVSRAKAKRETDKADAAKWRAIGNAIFKRDRGKCRACFMPLHQRADINPTRRAQAHHIVYRSAGGSDATANLITLCAVCHHWEHQHKIAISGDGDALVSICYTNPETGKLIQQWSSPCPTSPTSAEGA